MKINAEHVPVFSEETIIDRKMIIRKMHVVILHVCKCFFIMDQNGISEELPFWDFIFLHVALLLMRPPG